MRKRLLVLAAVLLSCSVSLTWNRLAYERQLLREPLVLPVFYQIRGDHNEQLHLSYLENRSEKRRVLWAELPIPGGEPARSTGKPYEYQLYPHHTLMKVPFQLTPEQAEAVHRSGKPITEARLYLKDGSSVSRSIGQIAVTAAAHGKKAPELPPFERRSASFSGTSGSAVFTANDDVRIEGIASAEGMEAWLTLSLSAEGLPSPSPLETIGFPLDIPKGGWLKSHYELSFAGKTGLMETFNRQLSQPRIFGVTGKGGRFEADLLTFFSPMPSDADVKLLVKQERSSR